MKISTVKELQNYIRIVMLENNTKISDLSQKMNIPRSTIDGRLNNPNVSMKLLLEICEALDADLDITIIPRDH